MEGQETFGAALRRSLREAGLPAARLAEELRIDPGAVSRWVNDKARPAPETLQRIEVFLGIDLSSAYLATDRKYEVFISSPITGIGDVIPHQHHADVAQIVEAVRPHVPLLYWPGEPITERRHLIAADVATERNMQALGPCSALVYIQFAELTRASSALIELGIALGRRIKTTIIIRDDLYRPFMLEGFQGVAAAVNFLPKARVYTPRTVHEICDKIEATGREMFGLK